MLSRSNTAEERTRFQSATPGSLVEVCGDTDYTGLEGRSQETHGPQERPHTTSSSASTALSGEEKGMVITSIRATDVVLGLRRLPAGFYALVRHSGLQWRTENKSLLVDDDIVEWSERIPISSDPSSTVCLEVYASFEFQPMMGEGEQLRKLTITVEQLLDRSTKDIPFTFFPKNGDIVSLCSSVFVTVEQRRCESNSSSPSRDLGCLCSTTESRSKLEDSTYQGHNALSRYRRHGHKRDLERSVEEFEHALRICPMDHPCRAAAQANLATAKFILYRVKGTGDSLELSLYRNALAARPVGHIDRPSTLIQLAMVHLTRFENHGDKVEAVQADGLLHEAVELSAEKSHERRAASALLQLHAGRSVDSAQMGGQSSVDQDSASRLASEDPWISSAWLLDRFKRLGDIADLEQAIASLRELVRRTSVWDPRYRPGLGNLGGALCRRFGHLGELCDLEDGISTFKNAVALTPDGHRDKPRHFCDLGMALRARFERLGNTRDLEDAIRILRDAVRLTSHDDPINSYYLRGLGNSLISRFDHLGELSDLEEAVLRHKDAVGLISHDHPDRPAYLDSFGTSLITRFRHFGELSNLEDAVLKFKDAVGLTPHNHPQKPLYLHNLCSSLITRFEHIGEVCDIDDAILMLQEAVRLTHDHRREPFYHGQLGNAFKARFQRLGKLSDLEDAISMLMAALDLVPHDDPGRPGFLNDLGNCLRARFQRFGEPSDLERAVSMLRDAVDHTPHGHPRRAICLNNLGYSLTARFERFGKLSDLEDATSVFKDAVDLTPRGHPDRPGCLGNLGHCLIVRFERLGDLNDLEEAILMFGDAVSLTPHGHPDEPHHLDNLGSCYLVRFRNLGEPSDLEHTISKLEQAADLTPNDHPSKAARFNNLGNSFMARFEHLGDLGALADAIQGFKVAVGLTPDGHPDKAGRLSNLGSVLRARFDYLEEPSDLEDAISALQDAVNLTPRGHHDRPARLNNLGETFKTGFEHFGELSNLEQAIILYSHAASITIGPAIVRFNASLKWISCARQTSHHSLLLAYSAAINLLPQLAWIGLPLTDRFSQLARGAVIVREAAATALELGLPELAVEWLEQGRSIVWGELFQLRSSYDELSSAYPDHARRLQELSIALEHASAAHEKSLSSHSPQTRGVPGRAIPFQQEADRHRTLAIERDRLLQEIRRLPGFERFLLKKEFSRLRSSAHSGPVVILNAARDRCDALIVLADVDHVIHVPLPRFPFGRSTGLHYMLQRLLGHHYVVRCGDREGNSATRGCVSWESLLSILWDAVVKPVLDALAFSSPGELSRIFWCPTGPFTFLPIHAAGLYGAEYSQSGHKVFDFVVSSYIPTLSILALSPNSSTKPSGDLRLLVVRQSLSDGLPRLPGVATELKHIRTAIQNSSPALVTLLEPCFGTVEEVLALMKEADWVHFACHGIQDAEDTGLCLADGRRLKLQDIVALSRPRGGLAFLSACQTATGDLLLSDEAVHIAAGMLYAGYGGVIGTMWSISDKLAPGVARDVYERLFRNGTPDYREAAFALHGAIGRLRDSGKASFVTWLPFIHVGL